MSGRIPEGVQEAEFPISLYFHIPFCTRKCDYCHFYVLPNHEHLHKQLMDGLLLEWQQWKPELSGKHLVSVYFGGGTPALLGPERIRAILDWVREVFPDDLKTAEISLEANPENVSQQSMEVFRQAGINRVSIGIQTLHDPLLKVLSRTHSASRGIEAVLATSAAGISNISIDLMYDLPGQTLSAWQHTVDKAIQLPITHLSLYNLTLEPHTVFFKYKDSISKQMPDPEASKDMYTYAVEALNRGELYQYEISAFAKDNLISRHNSGYWTGRPFLGLGPSAFSFWKGKRFRNTANLSKYLRLLSLGDSPIDFSEGLEAGALRKELFVIRLRLREGVHLPSFVKENGALEADTVKTLEALRDQKWIDLEQQRVSLTDEGLLFYDLIASELI